jgi:acyl carrier protein
MAAFRRWRPGPHWPWQPARLFRLHFGSSRFQPAFDSSSLNAPSSMDDAAQPFTPSADASAASTLTKHFSVDVREAYERFRVTRDPASADVVVLAVVLDHMPDKARCPSGTPADELGLIADLGFDSIAITEMVFFLEDLFSVRIGNDEILGVRTVGDLRSFLRRKIVAEPAASA